MRRNGVLDDVEMFDAGFFGIGARDAAIMDPQHRHFIECVWEALETSGHVPDTFPGSIGLFAGCGMNTYMLNNLLTNPNLVEQLGMFLLRHTANDKDFLTTTVSYRLDLRGPSVNVQTACSTSLGRRPPGGAEPARLRVRHGVGRRCHHRGSPPRRDTSTTRARSSPRTGGAGPSTRGRPGPCSRVVPVSWRCAAWPTPSRTAIRSSP